MKLLTPAGNLITESEEKFIESNGWVSVDYPYPRSHSGYSYTVYSHKDFEGVWDIGSALDISYNVWL